MFLRIAGARSAKQSGIKGGKIPFDPNIVLRPGLAVQHCLQLPDPLFQLPDPGLVALGAYAARALDGNTCLLYTSTSSAIFVILWAIASSPHSIFTLSVPRK